MNGWHRYRLEEISQIVGGGTPSTAKDEYWNGSIPWLAPKDLTNYDRRYISRGERNISEEGLRNSSSRVLPKNSILMSSRAPIGYLAIAANDICTNQGFKSFIPDAEKVDFEFFYYLLKANVEYIKSLGTGTTFAEVSGGRLKGVEFDFPPLEEQKAIAKVLSSLDDKIELNRRMNATLEAMARALFKAWFVDFEPVHANRENRPSTSASPEIAKLFPSAFENGIPKGWRKGVLSDIAVNSGQNIDPTKLDPETPYVGLEHIPRKSLSLTDWGFASQAESTKAEFKQDDILFGKLRPYFHKVVIAPVGGICSTDILVIRPKEKHFSGHALMEFSSDEIIQYADKLSNGAKMPRTSWADLAKFETVIPTKKISETYTTFVSALAGRILKNINESKVLEETLDSLLPRLVSGKLKV